MSVEELRQLADRLRAGRLVQQSRTMTCTISGLPTDVQTGEVREHAHPDAIAAADAIEWLLSDRHQAEEAMRETCAKVAFQQAVDRDAAVIIRDAIRSIDTRGE